MQIRCLAASWPLLSLASGTLSWTNKCLQTLSGVLYVSRIVLLETHVFRVEGEGLGLVIVRKVHYMYVCDVEEFFLLVVILFP